MLKIDLHTHTIASGHASGTISSFASTAMDRGLCILGISDHSPKTQSAATPSYFRSLKIAPKIRFGVRMLYGVEASILGNGEKLDIEDDVLAGLDYAIVSMHVPIRKPENITKNTEAFLNAMQHPNVRIIGHCDDVRYPVDFQKLVLYAIEHNVIAEINETSLAPDSVRGNTKKNLVILLNLCRKYNLPVIIGSDSHEPKHVGMTPRAEALLKELNFPESLILNENPHDLLRMLNL